MPAFPIGRLWPHPRFFVRCRCRHRTDHHPAGGTRAGAEYRDHVHRAAAHPQQSGRVDFQLHNQELSEPVPVRRVGRQQVYVIARGGYDRCDIGGFDPGVPFLPLYSSGMAMRAAARNPVSSRLVGLRVGRMSAFGWGLAAAIGAVAGMMARRSSISTPI